jgi:hypothetical protein
MEGHLRPASEPVSGALVGPTGFAIGAKAMSRKVGMSPRSPAKRQRIERLQVVVPTDELTAIDDFQFRERIPTRAAAVRELLRRGLAATNQDSYPGFVAPRQALYAASAARKADLTSPSDRPYPAVLIPAMCAPVMVSDHDQACSGRFTSRSCRSSTNRPMSSPSSRTS